MLWLTHQRKPVHSIHLCFLLLSALRLFTINNIPDKKYFNSLISMSWRKQLSIRLTFIARSQSRVENVEFTLRQTIVSCSVNCNVFRRGSVGLQKHFHRCTTYTLHRRSAHRSPWADITIQIWYPRTWCFSLRRYTCCYGGPLQALHWEAWTCFSCVAQTSEVSGE